MNTMLAEYVYTKVVYTGNKTKTYNSCNDLVYAEFDDMNNQAIPALTDAELVKHGVKSASNLMKYLDGAETGLSYGICVAWGTEHIPCKKNPETLNPKRQVKHVSMLESRNCEHPNLWGGLKIEEVVATA